MGKFIRRARLVVASFVLVLTSLSPLAVVHAAADTCTWTGAGNALLNNPANWTGCDNTHTPENGDILVFPDSASIKNVFTTSFAIQPQFIEITGTNYVFSGATAITLPSTGVGIRSSENVEFDVPFTIGTGGLTNATISTVAGKTMTFANPITLNTGAGEVNIGSGGHDGTVVFGASAAIGGATSQFIAQNGATAAMYGTNTFTAATVGAESNGIFECRSAACFGSAANSIYSGGGIVSIYSATTFTNGFQTSSTTPDDSVLNAYENVTIAGSGTVNDALTVDQHAATKSLQFTGAITLNNNITTKVIPGSALVRFDSSLSGTGGIAAVTGRTFLSTGSTFDGAVTVASGAIVAADDSNSFGSTVGSTTVADGASVQFVNATPVTVPEAFSVAGAGVASSPAAIYSAASDDVTLSGTITLTGDTTIQTKNIGKDIIITSVISGTGDLSLLGAYSGGGSGSISLDGVAPNTYDGTTYMLGGVVYAEKAGAIPGDVTFNTTDPTLNPSTIYLYNSTDVVSDTSIVTLNDSNDTFQIGNTGTETIGGLAGTAGQVAFQSGGSGLIINQNFNSTYGGDFYADGNLETVTKRGTGTLLLTGTSPYSFDEINFVVEQGTLSVNGNVKTNTGSVTVQAGGVLKGSGTVGSIVTTGGKVAPGNSPGILHAAGLALNASTSFEEEIAGATAGTQYDQLIATGAVTLGGATLSVVPTYTPTAGTVFTIITGASVSGTFNGLANGATLTANGLLFRINYTGTTVTLTYVRGTVNTPLADTGSPLWAGSLVGTLMIAGALATTRRKRSI